MNGYNIIYKKRRGCLHSVIMGRPISSRDLFPNEELEIIRTVFANAHPSWTIIAIIPGDYSELSAFSDGWRG